MLILTRRIEEAIIIGGDVEIKALGIDKRGQIKLGLEVPEEVLIMREKLLNKESNV